MTPTIILLIFISAGLHASWNLLSKQGRPSTAFFILMSFSNILWWLWTVFAIDLNVQMLGWKFYLAFVCSLIAECTYFIGIARAYKVLDISLGYPMIRSIPVLMIAVITFVFPPHAIPSLLGMTGLLLVALGCLLMPLKNWKEFHYRNYVNPALKYILLAASGTVGYTLMDAFAIKELQSAANNPVIASCFYLFLMEMGISCCLFCFCMCRESEKQEFIRLIKMRSWKPMMAGLASSSAYGFILYSMSKIPASDLSFLQAFRQISLPIGVVLGMWVLKEKVMPFRWVGVGFILGGLVIIALQ